MKKIYSLFSLFVLLVLSNNLFAQSYCMLPGRTPYDPVLQPGIRKFKLNKINRNSSNVESMSSVVVSTGLEDSLVGGNVYTVTIIHSEDSINFAGGKNNIRVFIDYNNDFDYLDAGETVISKNLIGAGVYTGTFMVPANVQSNLTGMRVTVKMSEDLGHTAITPCDNPADPLGYHGEIEDYIVDLYPKPAPPNLTGISSEANDNTMVQVYPNPAKDELTVRTGKTTGTTTVELCDITGKKIQTLVSNDPEIKLPVQNCNSGIYFVNVRCGNTTSHHKIIIE
jgi:hypothetical protein